MMGQPVLQGAFHAGEWSPSLYAAVSLQKYHAAAALVRNFFVDYRGGVSTRFGSKYILQAFKSSTQVRLIPFQASATVGYALEFGNGYIRFYNNGAPVLETAKNITGAAQSNPCSITSNGHGFSAGDWVFISNIVGMTQLNGKYYQILSVTTNTFSLGKILDGSNVNSLSFTPYSSGGTVQRIYTLASPFLSTELSALKFAQNVNTLVLCHPSHPPYLLTLIAATNWTLNSISFGATVSAPTGVNITTTLTNSGANYAYVVTAVDANGQESVQSTTANLLGKQDLRTVQGTNVITWVAAPGAVSYNVYKAEISYSAALPTGTQFGFIGNVTGISFIDSNIAPDFSQTPPITENPFQGAGVASFNVTNPGAYLAVPTVTVAPPSSGAQATAQATLGAISGVITSSGLGYSVGQIVNLGTGTGNPTIMTIKVLSIGGSGQVITFSIVYAGSILSGSVTTALVDTAVVGLPVQLNITYGVISIALLTPGAGYTTVPAVTFSSGTAAATAVLAQSSAGNPTVPVYFDQRLYLMGPPGNPKQFNASQPLSYFNFNVSNPTQDDDAIFAVLDSTVLNTIEWGVPLSTGMLILSDRQAWIINGGSSGAAPTPVDIIANAQARNGAAAVCPPIQASNDILFVQQKGSIVRDVSFDFYRNAYLGTDISVLSAHLFFGYQLTEWAWAEEPYKIVWAVRSDGQMLSLTFLKEQELIGWTHHDTNGLYKSVCTVTEAAQATVSVNVDAVYQVVQRTINGNTVQYIERMADRFPQHYNDTSIWCVDAGLQYNSTPATVFTGLDHLVGATITGLADGSVIPNTVVAADGSVTLAQAASVVTIGLSYLPQFGTLPLDLGEPTVQGKRKGVSGLSVKVFQTLGLWCGRNLTTLVQMKDLVLGNLNIPANTTVTDLVTSDARTVVDPQFDTFGTYFITQPNPYPATILGVVPEIEVGDTP